MKARILGLLWIAAPPAVLFAIQGSFFASIVLYLVIPSAWFALSNKGVALHAAAVAVCSLPCVTFFDYLAYANQAWSVRTVFDFRVLNVIPIEDYLFTAFACFAAVAAYASFTASRKQKHVNTTSVLRFLGVACAAVCILLVIRSVAPNLLRIRYYYAWLDVTAFVLPVALFLRHAPAFIGRFIRMIPFVFTLMFVYEITALRLGMWAFPSTEYLLSWHVLAVQMPIEEVLAWMILFVPISVAFSETITSE
jgi:hypothetical protein